MFSWLSRLRVTTKIAVSYLAIAVTSLVAVGFALQGLHHQRVSIEHLVAIEFRAATLARDLRENVLAQEVLGKQQAILQSPELVELLERRERDFDAQWSELQRLSASNSTVELATLVEAYQLRRAAVHAARQVDAPADEAALLPVKVEGLSGARTQLVQRLSAFREAQSRTIDAALHRLSAASSAAFRWSMALLFGGLLLGVPVALSIAASIHRSMRGLVVATQRIGAGQFEVQLEASSDEFAVLAREFHEMGRKLRELERLQLDANPLTHLPGNLASDRELERRIRERVPFAHAYVDLDNFKAFNDRYGYQRGNDVIAFVGELLEEVVRAGGDNDDLVGHIGGDDFVLLSTPERIEPLARAVIERFDRDIVRFYSDEDLARGSFVGKDRFGVEREFPLMSISIAVVCSDNVGQPTAGGIVRECARMKEHLKNQPGSNVLIDRRKGRGP